MGTYVKVFVGAMVFALAVAVAPSVSAQTWDDETFVTFDQPVELPGIALPAGTYIFRLPDGISHPRVVQVLSEDRTKVYGMFSGVERTLVEPTKSPVEMFKEAAPGSPVAVRSWFLPDDGTLGVEFIYPKAEAKRIASANHERVLSANGKSVG